MWELGSALRVVGSSAKVLLIRVPARPGLKGQDLQVPGNGKGCCGPPCPCKERRAVGLLVLELTSVRGTVIRYGPHGLLTVVGVVVVDRFIELVQESRALSTTDSAQHGPLSS